MNILKFLDFFKLYRRLLINPKKGALENYFDLKMISKLTLQKF